jgi:integrase
MEARIRRSLGKVGRLGRLQIRVSGNARFVRACETAIDKLIDDGQVDVLRALRDGKVMIAELVDVDRQGKLSGSNILTSVVLSRRLWPTWKAAIEEMGDSERTRKRYHVTRRALMRELLASDLPRHAPILALRDVDWRKLRQRWLRRRSPSDWNHVTRGVSHFLTVALGDKWHPFRREVTSQFKTAKERVRSANLSTSDLWRIVEHAREDIRPVIVTLAAAGLRIGEYLSLEGEASLVHSTCTVVVRGKTGERKVAVDERFWPWVVAAAEPPLAYKRLRHLFGEACRAAHVHGVTLHSLRHLYGETASDAGAPLGHVKNALGHENLSTSERYTRTTEARETARKVGTALRLARGTDEQSA